MALDIAESAELLHKKQAQTIERKACKNVHLAINHKISIQLKELEVNNKVDKIKVEQLRNSLEDKSKSVSIICMYVCMYVCNVCMYVCI